LSDPYHIPVLDFDLNKISHTMKLPHTQRINDDNKYNAWIETLVWK